MQNIENSYDTDVVKNIIVVVMANRRKFLFVNSASEKLQNLLCDLFK